MTDPEGELAALLPRLQRSMRVHYLDNLRSTLIALVIFHHSALPFGGIGYWPYISPYHPPDSSLVLGVFVAVNQTYFMGMLFFLSGHFSAIAASKKSWVEFSVDKLRRLGIPTVVSTIFLQPLVLILVKWAGSAPILPALLEYFKTLRGVRGPVWFLATLLVFDLTLHRNPDLPSLTLIPAPHIHHGLQSHGGGLYFAGHNQCFPHPDVAPRWNRLASALTTTGIYSPIHTSVYRRYIPVPSPSLSSRIPSDAISCHSLSRRHIFITRHNLPFRASFRPV
ncbi:hypothetical protein C8J57DRAFT_1653718 [Mycena rebaudengoi]|nr:hypothetical protein C8J57DRAFT_1653718 [Mycena rebaudengoi]